MSASSSDAVNTDPSRATTDFCKPMSVPSMPDVIASSSVSYSRMAENSLEADTDIKPVLSFPNADVSVSDLSSLTHSLPTITMHSTSDSSYLEQTRPEINYKTISLESHQTDNYSSSTFATDSEKPAEPVPLEHELNISLPQSSATRTNTIIKSSKRVTFDLSGPSDPISPDHSQKGLSNNMSHSDVETLTETSAEDRVSQGNDQDKWAYSSETSSGLLDSGVSSTLIYEPIPTITIHPPPHLDEYCEEDVQEASTESSELTGEDETTAESMTTGNGLQMSVKNKYGPEVEEESRLDPDFLYKCHVTSIQKAEIITTEESMTSRNEDEKCEREVEEQMDIYHSSNQEKVTKSGHVLTREQMLLHKVSEKIKVEEQRDELQMVQSPRETSATQGTMEAEVCEGTDVLTDQAERQIHHLAPLKPALPVNQECGPEECTPAPPFSDPVKVSLADSSVETHGHLESWLRPLAPNQPSREITILEDTARCKYLTSTDNNHAEREERPSSEETTFLTSLKHISTAATAETSRHGNRRGEVTVTEGKAARDHISHRNLVQISESTPDDRSEKEDTAEIHTFADQLLSRSLIPGER